MNIQNKLFELRDEEYAAFQAKLTPNVAGSLFIGVRVPALRAFARESYRISDEKKAYLNTLKL